MDKMSNKICALFVGRCWHEGADNTCIHCKRTFAHQFYNPDYSLRGQDWWELWERVTKDEKFFFRFQDFCSSKKGNHQDMFLVWFVNNLHENVCDYLRYAYKEGRHPELFKEECPNHDRHEIVECYYQHDCEMECAGTGTIDTLLAKAVREGK